MPRSASSIHNRCQRLPVSQSTLTDPHEIFRPPFTCVVLQEMGVAVIDNGFPFRFLTKVMPNQVLKITEVSLAIDGMAAIFKSIRNNGFRHIRKQNGRCLYSPGVGRPPSVRDVDLLGNRSKIRQGVHHNRQWQRDGPRKQAAIAAESPEDIPELTQRIPLLPHVIALEINPNRVTPEDVMENMCVVSSVHKDQRREGRPGVEVGAFFQAVLTK